MYEIHDFWRENSNSVIFVLTSKFKMKENMTFGTKIQIKRNSWLLARKFKLCKISSFSAKIQFYNMYSHLQLLFLPIFLLLVTKDQLGLVFIMLSIVRKSHVKHETHECVWVYLETNEPHAQCLKIIQIVSFTKKLQFKKQIELAPKSTNFK